MFKSLCILGRQSALSLAELESLFGADKIKPTGDMAALLDIQTNDVPFSRLGGTIKLCKVLAELPTTNWKDITDYLVKHVPEHAVARPEGKIKFGISAYDLGAKPNAINATGLAVKKAVKAVGRSMRVIPNSSEELNSAQVLHNKLADTMGMELILVRHGRKTILAQTVNVQDIEAYAARDQARPARDARVGMLPPKLAQITINLAVGIPEKESVLDPFCGTGVIIQEAMLMGYSALGTDLEPRMVQYSQVNLDWLELRHNFSPRTWEVDIGDATSRTWDHNFDTIACETYLGRAFSTEPSVDKLREVIQDVDTIHKKFLRNVTRQTKPGFRMCIAVPAWHTSRGVKHLPILDQLTDMGYTRMSFVHASNSELIYHREGQVVGRELVTLIRK